MNTAHSRGILKTITMITYLLLALAAIITSSGQLLMKKGSQVLQNILSAPAQHQVIFQLLKKFFAIVFEPHVFTAFTLYFIGSFLWLKLLTRGELNYLYPILIGLTVTITSALSVFIFKETLTAVRVVGIIFIIIGITLVLNFKLSSN